MMGNENNPYSELIKYYDTRIEMGEKLSDCTYIPKCTYRGVN